MTHIERPAILALAIFAIVGPSCIVLGDEADGILAAMRERRESLRSYNAVVHYGEAGNRVACAGDYLVGAHRCEFGTDGSKAAVLLPDRMFYSTARNEPGAYVFIDQPRPGDVGISPLIDLRAIGITNFADNSEVDSLARNWQHNISNGRASVLSRDGDLVSIAVESETDAGTSRIPKVKVFAIDVEHGYSLKRMDGYLGVTTDTLKANPKMADSRAHYQSIATSWEERSGEWVPTESTVTYDPGVDNPRVESVRIEWVSVNAPIDPGLFSYASLGSSGSPVYDDRVEPSVLVEYLPYAPDQTASLGNSIGGSSWLRWVLLLAGAVLAGLAGFGILRQSSKRGSSGKPGPT